MAEQAGNGGVLTVVPVMRGGWLAIVGAQQVVHL